MQSDDFSGATSSDALAAVGRFAVNSADPDPQIQRPQRFGFDVCRINRDAILTRLAVVTANGYSS